MALVAPFDQAVAARLLGVPTWAARTPPAPIPALLLDAAAPTDTHANRRRRERIARLLVHVLLESPVSVGGLLAEVEASLDEHVTLWSPAIATTSRAALLAALLDADDAVDDVAVSIVGQCLAGSTGWVEWQATGTFRNAGFLNDDVLVEPSGSVVQSCGVLVLDFTQSRVRGIRCYYDGLRLLGQVLTHQAASR